LSVGDMKLWIGIL